VQKYLPFRRFAVPPRHRAIVPSRIGMLTRGVAQRRCMGASWCIPMPHPRANIMNPYRAPDALQVASWGSNARVSTCVRTHRAKHTNTEVCYPSLSRSSRSRALLKTAHFVIGIPVCTKQREARCGDTHLRMYMQRHANRRGKIITDKQCVNTRYTRIQRGHICHYIRISTKTVVADIKYVLHEVVSQSFIA
jgi:hypothetical protein